MIGKKIKELRESLGYTQSDLAKRINATQQQVHRWESGQFNPSADMIAKIAAIYGVSADYLLGTENARETLNDLSPMERRLIFALRSGMILEALESLTDISKHTGETDITGTNKSVDS